jgi:hypothetical protein
MAQGTPVAPDDTRLRRPSQRGTTPKAVVKQGRTPTPGKRPRIQLDLSPKTFTELETLAGKHQMTVNEFARAGMRFYRWYLENKAKGYQLMIEKDGKAAAIDVLL